MFNAIEVGLLHMFLALFVKNGIFCLFDLQVDFLTLKMTLSHKKIKEMDCPVKITWKWGITLVSGFIC